MRKSPAGRSTLIPFLAPTQIKRLAEEPAGPGHDLSSLRAIAWGGAPMYVEDARRAAARFGPILTELYGLGESPMTITALSRRAMAAELEKAPPLLTAGLPRTDVEIRIVNEAGQPLPAGSAGEVLVRGGVVMKGYWNNPQATAESLRQGWLHTGDIGYLDERGFLYLVDRKNDMILSGGYNIYPREVEEALMEHPQVAEVAVFGVPDPEWGGIGESSRQATRPASPAVDPGADCFLPGAHCQLQEAAIGGFRGGDSQERLWENAAEGAPGTFRLPGLARIAHREARRRAMDCSHRSRG